MIFLQSFFKYMFEEKELMKMEREKRWNIRMEAMKNINICNY